MLSNWVPTAVAVVVGCLVGVACGVAVFFAVRSVLSGHQGHLKRDLRLFLGGLFFASGGLLDLAVWMFKPE